MFPISFLPITIPDSTRRLYIADGRSIRYYYRGRSLWRRISGNSAVMRNADLALIPPRLMNLTSLQYRNNDTTTSPVVVVGL